MTEQALLISRGWTRTISGLWSHPDLPGIIFHTDTALRTVLPK